MIINRKILKCDGCNCVLGEFQGINFIPTADSMKTDDTTYNPILSKGVFIVDKAVLTCVDCKRTTSIAGGMEVPVKK